MNSISKGHVSQAAKLSGHNKMSNECTSQEKQIMTHNKVTHKNVRVKQKKSVFSEYSITEKKLWFKNKLVVFFFCFFFGVALV